MSGRMMNFGSATEVWLELLSDLVYGPDCVCKPRGREVHELRANQTVVDMHFPIVRVPARKLGYRFMSAEAYWILTGDNRVSTIKEYSPTIAQFSDDGYRFDGAYGPRVVDQLRYVVETIHEDCETRQAIIDIWRQNPRVSNDIPCTLSLQFMPRGDVIHTIATMRSSDVWLGWPYDVFNFTMITSYIILMLRHRYTDVYELGNLYLTAGSQHLYTTELEAAKEIVKSDINKILSEDPEGRFAPHIFSGPDELIRMLEIYRAPNTGIDKCPLFLRCLGG